MTLADPVLLGLDFGGTKLAAGLVDQHGAVLASARCATPLQGGASASLDAMLALARDVLVGQAGSQLSGVGVSFGGPVAADGRTVRLSMHVPGWEHVALAELLEAALGVPARIANDGDAAALAEYHFGAGRGVQHLLYMTISTGIGGGLIIAGQLHRGAHAWAGEIGHMVLDPAGPPCPCGRTGCLESLASGRSIARAFAQQRPEQPLSAEAIAQAAARGDALAQQIWDEAMRWLGLGIASAANLLNPGLVVLGGGLTRAGEQLFAPVRQVVAGRVLDPDLSIVAAALGDHVGILGGAALLLV